MRDRKISRHQLYVLLFLTLFPLGTECLPGVLTEAGAAAWLCPLLTGGGAVLLSLLGDHRQMRGENAEARSAGGPEPGRGPALLFLAGDLWLLAVHGARIGSRLSGSLRASPVLLTAAVLLLAGWMAAGGLPALARACEIFSLAVGGGFALMLLFGLPRLSWGEVLLWRTEELAAVPAGALGVLGVLAPGGYVLFLLEDVRPEGDGGKGLRRRLAALALLLSAGLVLILGRLGAALGAQLEGPFFQMVSGLGFEGAFQRLEEPASALWVLGDGALLALLLLAGRRLLARALGRKEKGWMGWLLAGAAFLGGLMGQGETPLPLSAGGLGLLALLVLFRFLWGGKEKKKKIEKSA